MKGTKEKHFNLIYIITNNVTQYIGTEYNKFGIKNTNKKIECIHI